MGSLTYNLVTTVTVDLLQGLTAAANLAFFLGK